MKPGDRVETPDGPGKIVGPWLNRGLRRHGHLEPEGWIVALDQGRRRVYRNDELEPEPSAIGEHLAEARAIEDHQERKHGDPG